MIGVTPCVSILLPTFNRAPFLEAAFSAILAQTCVDWELVVVDDGSADETADIVERLRERVPQTVRYLKQENQGAYGARNTALNLASAPVVAFYDSDDVWLPHHLSRCLEALDGNHDVDWVYAACRIVDHATKREMSANTFRIDDRPRPFMALRTESRGRLRLFTDDRLVEYAISHGLYCGLQNSVIRRSVFASERFRTTFRNEAEDQLFLARALKRGCRLGYIDDIHVVYHIHESNSSAPATGRNVERDLAVYRPLARGFEELLKDAQWSRFERRALARRLAREHFWHIGYNILWRSGRRSEALESFRTALRWWPWSPQCWKTYLLARLQTVFQSSKVSNRNVL